MDEKINAEADAAEDEEKSNMEKQNAEDDVGCTVNLEKEKAEDKVACNDVIEKLNILPQSETSNDKMLNDEWNKLGKNLENLERQNQATLFAQRGILTKLKQLNSELELFLIPESEDDGLDSELLELKQKYRRWNEILEEEKEIILFLNKDYNITEDNEKKQNVIKLLETECIKLREQLCDPEPDENTDRLKERLDAECNTMDKLQQELKDSEKMHSNMQNCFSSLQLKKDWIMAKLQVLNSDD